MQRGDDFKSNLQEFDELIAQITQLEKDLQVAKEGLKLIKESNDPVGIDSATLDALGEEIGDDLGSVGESGGNDDPDGGVGV